ncbi:hypothetical protein COO60DRAFT_927828 [Scenedesmus sp. NREL 46B-D3]|nr:hypothetical protein COO60DRAFT_927828 [Scenedesmus sp. NREL 46B-D3]
MLLSRLVGQILACGCMVCFTSNRPARDLYKGGLSRKYFEPFIQLIDERLLQLRVAGGKDYRAPAMQQQQQQHAGKPFSRQQQGSSSSEGSTGRPLAGGAWLVGAGAEQQLQQRWQQLADQLAQLHSAVGATAASASGPASVPLPFGRKLWVPRALLPPTEGGAAPMSSDSADRAGQQQQQQQQQQGLQGQLEAALFTFEQLCGNGGSRQSLEHAGVLSANDYLALVRACPILFVSGLPQLQLEQRDEARRLVTFVDVAYEAHTIRPGSVKLFVSGQVTPHEVFLPLLGAAAAQGINPNIGKAKQARLDVQQLVQEYGAPRGSNTRDVDDLGSAAGEIRGSRTQPASQLPSALLPEEVLMYHRASSRLAELCAVTEQHAVQ